MTKITPQPGARPAKTPPKPGLRPANPNFASGPCAKRPGWSPAALAGALTGRSHRSKPGKARIKDVLQRTRALLGVPAAHRIAIVPASDTGAVEMALWSLLGARGVDVLAWESFGFGWVTDVVKQLKIVDVRVLEAPYGELPDLARVDFARDVVFTWNGTTSGVRVPDGDWIAAARPDRGASSDARGDSPARQGLTICDATSAAFAYELPWDKLDVATYSWQKVLGGEAQHGILILSPRAVARLESHTPPWPLPKIFRLTKGGKLIEGVFEGETINTPSMLCVEDALDGLKWAERAGGLEGLIARSMRNAAAIEGWVARTPWIENLARAPKTRSRTSVCLVFTDPLVAGLAPEARVAFARKVSSLLEQEGAGYDIAHHRDAPAGLRLWAGATVETADLEALFPWIEWAFAVAKSELGTEARP
ncbi:MAG: phosphoserine aminotransferase [Rhodospirillales bacterium RIFCSPLOWO2_12_FULL_67_15]|nr:MAG: phosphoserine aminotransferase [Rhodospirillales bacterium RIFCSPLOWO2_12_FULL_67_15]